MTPVTAVWNVSEPKDLSSPFMAPKTVMLASITALPHHGYDQPQQRIGEKNQRSDPRGPFLMSSLHVSFMLMPWFVWFLPFICELPHKYLVLTRSICKILPYLVQQLIMKCSFYNNRNLYLILVSFSVGFNEITFALWDMYIPLRGSLFCHSGPSRFSVLLQK